MTDTNDLSNINPPPPLTSSGSRRRSSFGFNFLSNITSSMRVNNNALQPNMTNSSASPSSNSSSNRNLAPPVSSFNQFMSNSPTIANISDLANDNSNLDSEIVPTRSPRGISQQIETNNNSNTDIANDDDVDFEDADEEVDDLNHITNESHLEMVDEPINDKDGFFSIRLTPLIDHSSSSSGLYFTPVIRKLKPNNTIPIGRYTDKNRAAAHAPQGSSASVVFKSKVVSRSHAEFRVNSQGEWYIKDLKSSSGTFLNHIRLSPASVESKEMLLNDGDILQLGMDYRGGTEEVYRCVKMRIEMNKSWQRKVNQFNLEIHNKLKNMNDSGVMAENDLNECAICLLKLEPCQALFISPCSHSWHYKCIRPIIVKSYPQFYCPNCRSMCDLETDIED